MCIDIGHWVELQVRNDLRKQQHQAKAKAKATEMLRYTTVQ